MSTGGKERRRRVTTGDGGDAWLIPYGVPDWPAGTAGGMAVGHLARCHDTVLCSAYPARDCVEFRLAAGQ